MREHRYTLDLPHSPERLWALMQDYPRWPEYAPMVLAVEVLHPGDARGDGLGMFPYVDGYRFTVRAHLNLAFPESAPVRLDVLAHERGDVTTPFVERPALRIEER